MSVIIPKVVITVSSSARIGGCGRCGTGETSRRTFIPSPSSSSPGVGGNIRLSSRVLLPIGCRGRDETRHSRARGNLTVVRAEPTSSSFNDLLLQGGPLLLPLLLSTSAALYRGASKAAKETGGDGGGLAILRGAFGVLPKGMWVGIGLVWAYWSSTQLGTF